MLHLTVLPYVQFRHHCAARGGATAHAWRLLGMWRAWGRSLPRGWCIHGKESSCWACAGLWMYMRSRSLMRLREAKGVGLFVLLGTRLRILSLRKYAVIHLEDCACWSSLRAATQIGEDLTRIVFFFNWCTSPNRHSAWYKYLQSSSEEGPYSIPHLSCTIVT